MKPFRYPLDPILKQHEWEIDALKVELMTLNQALNAGLAELQKLNESVRGAELEILSMFQENALIDRDRKAIIETYLKDRRQRAEEKQEEIAQARAVVDRVFEQLSRKKQSQRGIEKHRERKRKEFDAEGVRRDALEADELWLAKFAATR